MATRRTASGGGVRTGAGRKRDVVPAAAMRHTRRDRAPRSRSKYKSRTRHTDYMLWVKALPCLMLGVWGRCEGPIEADHAGQRGVGRKAHDATSIPLCRYHHGASRFPRAWTQDRRRAWLHAAIVYTQACARAAGVAVPVDAALMAEYPTIAADAARSALAAASNHGSSRGTTPATGVQRGL